jgi:signal transduction histidine kinase
MSVFDRVGMWRGRSPAQTLLWVAALSFCVTGALLLAWDLIEHAYLSDLSGDAVHRMHVVRGISTGVLVSVGIAWLLMGNQERYERRMRRLQLELIRNERLAAVGELAGGIAHEIRNPLAGIGGALTMLAREIPSDDDTRELMGEIQKQIRRMEHLVADLLAYARPGHLRCEWVQVNSILKQAAAAIDGLPNLPESNLVLELDPNVPDIYADPRELEHAFENLVLNAFQAVSPNGTIGIRSHSDGECVFVEVRDDGVGMADDTRSKIFDPFFTTKARGTGLGLSLVDRAVKNYGGDITVHSTPNEGTVFTIMFPREASLENDSAKERNAPFERGA